MDLFFCDFSRHGRRRSRVWVAPGYRPTRYEVLQVRFPRAVFTGPTAWWLLGLLDAEPSELWCALENKARVPRTLDPGTVIVRTRRLHDDVLVLHPPGRHTALRVFTADRALEHILTRERAVGAPRRDGS